MNEAQRSAYRTVQLVTLTAFDDQGQVALDPMRQLIERSYAAGIRVFIPCAGSAEFDSLSVDEIVRVIGMVRKTAGTDAKVIAPVGRRLAEAIEIGKRSLEAGADSVLVMPLAFPYLADAGARDYYHRLIEEVDGPVLVYKKADIPSDRLLLDLAGHPRVLGVKYAVNDISAFQSIVDADGDRIDWYCGSAERFAPYFALAGARGYTSGAGNLCPRLTLAIHAALTAGDYAEALRLQRILLPIETYRARSGSSYNISMLKHAIRATGLDFGLPRPPQRQVTDAEGQEIDQLIRPILAAEESLAEK